MKTIYYHDKYFSVDFGTMFISSVFATSLHRSLKNRYRSKPEGCGISLDISEVSFSSGPYLIREDSLSYRVVE